MPFIDVQLADPHFEILHKVGATGILKGYGVPYKWANQTWFYPEREISEYELVQGLRLYFPVLANKWEASGEPLTVQGAINILKSIDVAVDTEKIAQVLTKYGFVGQVTAETTLNRRWTAVLIEDILKVFERDVDFKGNLVETRN